ncbi:MAG: hypothetical protein V4673_14365 [Pseudomonadota bacterium]
MTLRPDYLAMMRAHADEGGQLSHRNGLDLLLEVERLRKILDTPILEPFTEAVVSEAKHQVYRWGEEQDAQKTAWDWFWTLGHLGSKAAHAALCGDLDKAKHHTITAAALLANWHRHIVAASQTGAQA